jgi:hypothetical protein
MDALITTLLIVTLFILLGTGVWIGLALAGVAWIGMELFSSRPAGDAMAVTDMGLGVVVDADRAAAFRLDGRNPVSDAVVRRHVSRSRALARATPGTAAAHQYHRLHDLCRRLGFIGRNLRNDRQDDASRA